MDKKQEFLKKILATFKIEAEENIVKISSDLIELEKGCDTIRSEEILETIFRAAHSLKGASRAVNLKEIERLCHSFEDLMTAIRNKSIQLTPQVFNALNLTVNLLSDALYSGEGGMDSELKDQIAIHIDDLILIEAGVEVDIKESVLNKKSKPKIITDKIPVKKDLENEIEIEDESSLKNNVVKENVGKRSAGKNTDNETIRISTRKLDGLLIQSEEMLALKINAVQRTKDLSNTIKKIKLWNKEASSVQESSIKVKQNLTKLNKRKSLSSNDKEVEKIVQFYDWTNSYIKGLEKEIESLRDQFRADEHTSKLKIDTLLREVKEVISVPFSTLLNGFPKMVRDLSNDLGKKINFNIEGDAIEIDKGILEKLKNPLMHMLRNSIDYGIEEEGDRLKVKKIAQGNITLKIEQVENSTVEILIADDGAGLNRKKLKDLYIENEKIAESEKGNINESEYLNHIFKSGVSTSDIVTDLSGRGLGLAIVHDEIEKIGGSVNVESEEGKSTTFRINIPTSIKTFRGILIMSSGANFVVPTSKVERVLKVSKEDVKTVEDKATIKFENTIIPVVSLSDILELPAKEATNEDFQIMVLVTKGKWFGVVVDKVIDEQEVLIKNFNKQLDQVRNISGATILGSGNVVPILNVSELFESSTRVNHITSNFENDVSEKDIVDKSILVVEDSITSRTLLKNILETSGFKVTTAIDGVDGFTKFREGNYDIVISDVEMPRMNGFELTAKIRGNDKQPDIPLILLTSLAKREHKERGIDVGASAYIVKSNFDQSNLLEILDRLI